MREIGRFRPRKNPAQGLTAGQTGSKSTDHLAAQVGVPYARAEHATDTLFGEFRTSSIRAAMLRLSQGGVKKLPGRENRYAAERIENQQVLVSTYKARRLPCDCQRQVTIVLRVAARFD